MPTHFLVSTRPEPSIGAAVFAAGVVNPMEVLEDIELDLKARRVKGSVLFDLLLAHGNKLNRYFVAEFDGEHFKRARFQQVADRYAEFSPVSAKFLKEHVEEVDVSLLSKAMRYALSHGIPF